MEHTISEKVMVKMDELPIEMLLKIFSYVPDRKPVALVNRRFYDVVCTLDEPQLCPAVYERLVSIPSSSVLFVRVLAKHFNLKIYVSTERHPRIRSEHFKHNSNHTKHYRQFSFDLSTVCD